MIDLFPATLEIFAGPVGRRAEAQPWLRALPALVEEVRQRWALTLAEPFEGGSCSWVAPVTRQDGSPAVLKVSWPHREAAGEAIGLRAWDGRGAVHLLEHDAQHFALLLERCDPGTKLGSAHDIPAQDRLLVGCSVLRDLWSVPVENLDLESLTDVMDSWADELDERLDRLPTGDDHGLLVEGSTLLRQLPATATRAFVLHGDLNPGNVLSATRQPWLAIDGKPMIGDPAFEPWPLIEQIDDPFAHPDPRRVLGERFALVGDALGLDVDRMLAWAVARRCGTAMSAADDTEPVGVGAPVRRIMREARILARLLGI